MVKPTTQILVVDDEEAISWALQQGFTAEGWKTDRAASAESALQYLAQHSVDLVVMDVRLPGMDGLTAMAQLRECQPELPIVLITAFGTLSVAVSALRGGATEYITKPFELHEIVQAVRRCLERVQQPTALQEPTIDSPADGMIGKSPLMQQVFRNIAMVSAADIPVLITGESGTGKELVAQAIHRHSLRAQAPLFAVHLASLSAPLVESELFGHVKGSFTGAERDRQGVLEMAHGATVFFDEAGDIPLNVQVKLLRALEQREIVRVGDTLARPADFRVIAATHCDMQKAVTEGRIRQDFFYRISGFVITLPPLRERAEDIPLLANHFLKKVAPHNSFSEAALELLKQRSWPGNVRELRRAVESAAIVARGRTIQPEHVQNDQAFLSGGPVDLKENVKRWTMEQIHNTNELSNLYAKLLGEIEPALLATVLEHFDHNRTLAAEKLGLDRATLRKKLGG